MLKVLIVDDQPAVRTALEVLLEVHGIASLAATTAVEALDLVATEDVGVVVQDMNFDPSATDGAGGVRLFHELHALDPDLPIVLMTAWTSLETAVQLIKEGAADYLAKPWDDEKLLRTVANLLRLRELAQENTRLRAQAARARRSLAGRHELCGLVYASPAMQQAVQLAVSVAPSDAPVLITGQSGSGKEMLAEIVQANSRRRGKPFVKVNAGALPAELLEAELFGAEAGAFTGATRLRIGRFEAADGGTLFLDELGNLSLAGQAKLLRVLQSGEYERLGSSVPRRADVRVISATNADLKAAIAAGRFREDLYFRVSVIEIAVPPLAERAEDVVPLAEHFLARFAAGGAAKRLGEAARAALAGHDWPGNVRELANRVQRATLVAPAEEIGPEDLGLDRAAPARGRAAVPVETLDGDDALDRAAIKEALLRAGGVVSKAAAEMGVSRQAFYRRMERLGIVLERRPR